MKQTCLVLLLVMAGCNAHQVTYDTTLPRGKVQSEWTGHYFYGSVGHPEINVRAICPQGAAKIETYQSFGNGMIGALTLGIYTPRTIRITCVGQSQVASLATVNDDGDIQLVAQVNPDQRKGQ